MTLYKIAFSVGDLFRDVHLLHQDRQSVVQILFQDLHSKWNAKDLIKLKKEEMEVMEVRSKTFKQTEN